MLRAGGKLSIVCPVSGGTEVSGICIFNAGVDETRKLMDDDPAVKANVLLYDTYSCRSFPGDSLPG